MSVILRGFTLAAKMESHALSWWGLMTFPQKEGMSI